MIFATAGTKLYIGGVLAMQSADFKASDFEGEDWKEIGGLESLGTIGDTSEEIAVNLINESRTKRLKGPRNAGSMEIVFALNGEDEGQLALIAAEKTRNDYAFRLVFDDAPAGGTPSERLWIAKVGSLTEAYEGADAVIRGNATLWINSNIVRVAAAEP